MKAPHLRARYFRIMTFFSQAAADFIIWELFLSQIGFRKLARRTRSKRYRQTAARFRGLAIRMGGVMIKVGQFLSTRLDVLPPEITAELAGLQDEVPAEEFEGIRQLAEGELGASLGEKFESFDPQPLAAASLGQVHRARLHARDDQAGFRSVVVKIQRPFIEQLIEVDLSALRKVGGWLSDTSRFQDGWMCLPWWRNSPPPSAKRSITWLKAGMPSCLRRTSRMCRACMSPGWSGATPPAGADPGRRVCHQDHGL